jgi:uncharacterized lipoprotein NlpE involved in copper resistance
MNQLQTLPTYLTTLSTAFALTTLTMMGCTNKAGIDSASTQDASSSSSSSSSGSSNQSTAASYTVTIPIAVSFPLSVGSSSNGNLLSLQAPLVSVLGSSASSLLADIIANPSGANASKIVQIISSSSGLVGYTTLGSCVTSSGQWADTAVLIPGSSLAVIAKERLNLSVASTKVGGLCDSIGEHEERGIYIDEFAVEKFSRYLQKISTNDQEIIEQKEKAYQFVEEKIKQFTTISKLLHNEHTTFNS